MPAFRRFLARWAFWLTVGLAGALAATGSDRPGPKKCGDPLTGVWQARQYDAPYGEWYVFTLKIRRDSGGAGRLAGTVTAHMWEGGADQKKPPARCGSRTRYVVSMPAAGEIDGDRLNFGGVRVGGFQGICGGRTSAGGYNPDRFSGTVDLVRGVFRSVLNDSGRAVNEPIIFYRTSCG